MCGGGGWIGGEGRVCGGGEEGCGERVRERWEVTYTITSSGCSGCLL